MANIPDDMTVLDYLRENMIFDIDHEIGGLRIWEACDRYYHELLTPEQFEQLIREMEEKLATHKKMLAASAD